MDWDDLRYVLAIAREGSLNKAAVSLGVARPTVGRRLQGIEDTLGARLFDRTPEGFIATAAGAESARIAELMEGDVLGLETVIRGQDAELRGKLVVSTMDPIFDCFPAAFSSFTTRYPQVELTVSSSLEQISLSRREADVAIRMNNTPAAYLVGRKVGWIAFAAYASKDLVARIGPDATFNDYPWLHWDERQNPRWLDMWLAKHAPHAKIAMRLSETSSCRAAVRAGIGVHFLPCFDGDPDEELQRLGPLQEGFGRHLWLLTLPELRNTNRIRVFMQHMFEALRAEADLLAGKEGVRG